MEKSNRYQPQEIERITGINRKQIYEYDLLGIVKPCEIDDKNGYKYYDDDAVKKFGIISLLVKLGETPKTLQKKFNDNNFNIETEIDSIIKTANMQIEELNNVIKTAKELKDNNEITKQLKTKNKDIANADVIISKVVALGVPGLILITAISATGLAGAAALTTALAALGPYGMIGGIATLGIAGLVSEGITKYGFDKIFESVVNELYKKGESKTTICSKIDKYLISNDLKLKLKDKLEKM